ncbi:MAG: long-subunit fatty acid transport protein [Crocinitomicaceae bacterium]|jgi:long-subunit fatty acid transport protein
MNFPFRESYCFLFSLFISAFSLNAQTTTQVVVQDFETWSQIGVSKKFNDEFKMQLNQGLRLNDNSSSVDQVLTNLSGIYQKTDAVSFGFGIRYIRNKGNISGEFENLMRYNFDFGVKHQLDRFHFKYRLRLQTKDEIGYSRNEGDFLNHGQRLKVGVRYNIKNWKLDPKFSTELFRYSGRYMLSSFEKIRFTLGTEYKIKKFGEVGIFYRIERELVGTYPKTTNILGLNFTYKL